MVNNFVHEWTFPPSGRAIVAEAMLEDKLADTGPDYSCLYDMPQRCQSPIVSTAKVFTSPRIISPMLPII